MPGFIEVKGLTKRFKDHVVIDELNLSVAEGEVVVVQGPSGIGKSTFLRSLSYLEPFDQGTVRVGDVVVGPGLDEHRDRRQILALREQLGYVFQFFHLFPHLTVQENLTVGPVHVLNEPVEQANESARRLLARVGLAEKASSYPGALSGGQQQRVGIARALAMHPKAILFDEPTSSLDPSMKAEIIRVIRDFSDDKLTMILVTHEPAVLEKIATRLITFGPGCRLSADQRQTPSD